ICIASAQLINYCILSCQTPSTSIAIYGSNFINNLQIQLSAGEIDLEGTFTNAGLGTVVLSGGSMVLRGTMDNSATVFDLARTGTLLMAGGTIKGGTIRSTDGSPLWIGTPAETLDGATHD